MCLCAIRQCKGVSRLQSTMQRTKETHQLILDLYNDSIWYRQLIHWCLHVVPTGGTRIPQWRLPLSPLNVKFSTTVRDCLTFDESPQKSQLTMTHIFVHKLRCCEQKVIGRRNVYCSNHVNGWRLSRTRSIPVRLVYDRITCHWNKP